MSEEQLNNKYQCSQSLCRSRSLDIYRMAGIGREYPRRKSS